jgi:hypothetical protein
VEYIWRPLLVVDMSGPGRSLVPVQLENIMYTKSDIEGILSFRNASFLVESFDPVWRGGGGWLSGISYDCGVYNTCFYDAFGAIHDHVPYRKNLACAIASAKMALRVDALVVDVNSLSRNGIEMFKVSPANGAGGNIVVYFLHRDYTEFKVGVRSMGVNDTLGGVGEVITTEYLKYLRECDALANTRLRMESLLRVGVSDSSFRVVFGDVSGENRYDDGPIMSISLLFDYLSATCRNVGEFQFVDGDPISKSTCDDAAVALELLIPGYANVGDGAQGHAFNSFDRIEPLHSSGDRKFIANIRATLSGDIGDVSFTLKQYSADDRVHGGRARDRMVYCEVSLAKG